MLATIDDITAAQVDRDRKVHGVAFLRVARDGRLEHIPIDDIQRATRSIDEQLDAMLAIPPLFAPRGRE